MRNILFIVGSLREGSFNRQLAAEAEKIIGDRAEVRYLDYTEVPPMNQDIEYPAPEAVVRLRKTVAEADGLWIFTPEYNASYPGHLKNVLDWLSRPLNPGDRAVPTVIAGKKVALSGAGGNAATARSRAKLSELLTFIGAELLVEPQTGVALSAEAWTEGRMVLTEEQRRMLEVEAAEFLRFIG